jgi:cytochrome c peroxidase
MRFATFAGSAALALVAGAMQGWTSGGAKWSAEERSMMASLTLDKLEGLAPDPSNRVADDTMAARFGRGLFFDVKLSSNGKVSCASCHVPGRDFQDGTPLGKGVGVTGRRTMPIAGTAQSPWLFWDGRTDSQWAQALGPLESGVEHGGDRTQYAQYIAATYRRDYERVFGRLPDLSRLPAHAGPNGDSATRAAWTALSDARRENITRVYSNIGKAIAAFERRITFSPTRFDRYVAVELAGRAHTAADSLSPDEEAGLRLFIGKATCTTCHNGARLTDDHFHNTGVPASSLVTGVDSGRTTGVRQVVAGEFNCLSRYSDARPEDCSELRFAVTDGDELLRAFKTPSLRNVALRAPFMHAGQLTTLGDVIEHYNRAPRAPFGRSELKRLKLSATERRQIEAFLGTLSAPAHTLDDSLAVNNIMSSHRP